MFQAFFILYGQHFGNKIVNNQLLLQIFYDIIYT